jgi:hypothetical protein
MAKATIHGNARLRQREDSQGPMKYRSCLESLVCPGRQTLKKEPAVCHPPDAHCLVSAVYARGHMANIDSPLSCGEPSYTLFWKDSTKNTRHIYLPWFTLNTHNRDASSREIHRVLSIVCRYTVTCLPCFELSLHVFCIHERGHFSGSDTIK